MTKTVFSENGIGDSYDSYSYMILNNYNGISRSPDAYANLFANSWQARRVCEYYPNLMASTWGQVVLAESDNELLSEITAYTDKLKVLYAKGQILANIYGGATFVRLVDDNQRFEEPINMDNIKEIEYSTLYDRWDVFPFSTSFLKDYYNPEHYNYFSDYGKLNNRKIHCSRVARFRGKYLPPELMKLNDYWEESVLSEFLETYARYYASQTRTLEAIKTSEIIVVGIEDLDEYDQVQTKKKQEQIQRDLTQQRLLVKDKENIDINVLARKFSGLKDILESARKDMVASSGLTMPQLYQEFPSGFQATGKSELLSEAIALNNRQETKWGSLIRSDLKLIMAMLGKPDVTYEWQWNNPYFKTPSEESELKLNNARIDELYYNMGVLSAEEVRESHFGNSKYNSEITLKDVTK